LSQLRAYVIRPLPGLPLLAELPLQVCRAGHLVRLTQLLLLRLRPRLLLFLRLQCGRVQGLLVCQQWGRSFQALLQQLMQPSRVQG
jgi:hypothetical protein